MKYLLRPNCGKQKNPNPNYIPPATCKNHIADPGKMVSVTNADRIRAMSDEELAKEFAMLAGWDRSEYEKAKRIGIEKVMLDWLKQPAEV